MNMHKQKQKYKLLHIITCLNTGGAERALYNLLYGGLAQQFQCHVVSLMDEGTYGEKIRALGVPVTCVGMKRGIPTLYSLFKLRRIARHISPDIIQGWMYHGNIAGSFSCKFLPGSCILCWNIRQSLYDICYEKTMTKMVIRASRYLSAGPNAIIYNSMVSRGQHEKFGFHSTNGKVIPNGIDIEKFTVSRDANRIKMRKQLGISQDAVVIALVARLHPMKNHPLFIKAALQIAERYNSAVFLLCGRNVTYENEKICSLIPVKFRSRFLLLGERQDMPDLFAAMDIVSSSSSYGEAFPNVIGEAMACGLPCVVTDVGDSAYIVGDTGVVVPSRDLQAFIAGIEKLLVLSIEDRQQIGMMARTRVKKYFSLPAVVNIYSTHYEQLFQQLL